MTDLVAIINITPDSFSDGRTDATTEDYRQLMQQAVADGAAILDIGAESTRPGATPLTHEAEWQRLKPVLQHLPKNIPISLDTRHPETFRKALPYGIAWMNDVSGLQNPAMVAFAKDSGCKVVLMHSLTVPADSTITIPPEKDPVAEVLHWAKQRIAELEIPKEKIIFDPGLGFGKTAAQSQALIDNIAAFKTLDVKLMVGHSRKSFLGGKLEARDAATARITAALAAAKIDYVRVHNIKMNKAALE